MRSDRPARRERAVPAPLPLAHGELAPEDAAQLDSLKEQIRTQSGLFCQGYKERCLRRRIGVRMRARGVHRYQDYAALLEQDEDEYRRLLDSVTINVSKFFRNIDVWELLRQRVLPALFEQDRRIRIWSAGAASGEEPYTMAMVLLEYAHATAQQDALTRFSIEATDIDERALERARTAEYGDMALVETPPDSRRRWFEAGPPCRVREEVRRMVRFRTMDLIREPFPGNRDLIFCRNVFIYFERPVQEQLLQEFHDALNPGGFLVLGKAEMLLGPVARMLEPVSSRERVYRKP